jgi:hypothetical protein
LPILRTQVVTSRPLTGASTEAAAFLSGDRRGVGADYPDLAWNRQLGFFLRPGGDRTSKDPDSFARAVAISRRVQKPLYPASWLWQKMGPTDVASEALVCPDQPRSRQQ